MSPSQPLTLQSGTESPAIKRTQLDAFTGWNRPPPAFVADLSGGQVAHSLFDSRRSRHAKFRSTFGAVQIFGTHHFHAILDRDARLSVQETDAERVRFRLGLHLDNPPPAAIAIPRISVQGNGLAVDRTGVTPHAIPGTAFFASPVEPDNWGMWLLNVLPSIEEYRSLGPGTPFLCWVRFNWQRRLLSFLGVRDDDLIVQQEWQVYAPSALVMHQYSKVDLIPTASDQAVFRRVAAHCGATTGNEKLFISRRGFSTRFPHRRLLNEDTLIAALESRGFKTIEPETLSFADQVRAFRSAKLIVGLGGAAMFGTIFCPPDTRIVSIESSAAFADNHASLFAAMNHPYGFIFGQQDTTDETPIHKRWTLDIESALQQIDAFS